MKTHVLIFLFLSSVVLFRRGNTEVIVFVEDFERFDETKYDANKQLIFQGNTILGNFNNETLELAPGNLDRHQLVTISGDLYIHDSWGGNTTSVNGPDTWSVSVGDGKKRFESIQTSFSNSVCNTTICLFEADPKVFTYPNDPKTGLAQGFPGLCHFSSASQGTSMYRVTYSFIHSDDTMTLKLEDQLLQTDTDTQKCDEGWSIDNLKVILS